MPESVQPVSCGLYAITPEGLAPEVLLKRVEAALHGGAVFVQYRDKCCVDTRQRAVTAGALLDLCHRFGARLIVNDDLALALAIDADGVHLGGDDGDLVEARQALPKGKLLGASCYADFERARAATAAGVDYVAFGSVYCSPTKPLTKRAPLSLFSRCRAELPVSVCAIGGITVENAEPLLAAGANLLAVITDLFEAPDVGRRASAYKQLFERKNHELTQSTTI